MPNKKVKIEHIWSILCRQSILNADTNQISIMDVVDTVKFQLPRTIIKKSEDSNSKGFLVPVDLEIVSQFKKLPRDEEVNFDYRIRFLNSNDEPMGENNSLVTIEKQLKIMRVRAKFSSFAIEKRLKHGEYSVVVEVKTPEMDKHIEVARLPIEVSLQETDK